MSKRKVDGVFHALGDPTRRRILERLSRGPISVSALAEPLDMTLAAVVQHLQVLEDSGLVSTQKTGRIRTCNLEASGFDIAAEWLRDHRSVWDRRLLSLGELLDEPEERE